MIHRNVFHNGHIVPIEKRGFPPAKPVSSRAGDYSPPCAFFAANHSPSNATGAASAKTRHAHACPSPSIPPM